MPNTAIIIDRPSDGAKLLAAQLGVLRVRPDRAPRLRRYRSFINWGCSSVPDTRQAVLNPPSAVRTAVSKVASFAAVGDLCPPWSVTPQRFAGVTLARRDGLSGGAGIQVVRASDELPSADFYSQYIKKVAEYRVHVVGGDAIFIQQKRRRNGVDQNADQALIRNHDNGWVFCENNITYPTPSTKQELEECGIKAVSRLGLDFAAVDLIVEKGTNRVFFLEANTRPGLESSRLIAAYAEALGRE